MNRTEFDLKVRISQRKIGTPQATAEDTRLAYIANTVGYLDQLSTAQVKAEAKSKGLKVGSTKFDAQYAIGVWAADRQIRRDNGEQV